MDTQNGWHKYNNSHKPESHGEYLIAINKTIWNSRHSIYIAIYDGTFHSRDSNDTAMFDQAVTHWREPPSLPLPQVTSTKGEIK